MQLTALFELVMRRYNRRLFRIARAVLEDDADAEDALQQAYLSAFAHLAQWKGEARFSTWLARITLHEAFRRRRQDRRAPPAALDESRLAASAETPEALAAHDELARLIERSVEALPPAYRLVFVMREVEGLSNREVARCLSLSPGAVKVRLFRAKLLLREALAGDLDGTWLEAFQFLGPRCDRIVARVLSSLEGAAAVSGA